MRSKASIMHLDLDAFFAAVEQRDKPSLRGKPVIVGGVGPRGVVSTASYEARIFGVGSAMPSHEARRRCPHAAFLAGRFEAYRTASQDVMQVLREVSPLVEPLSLDEAFVDLASAADAVDLDEQELAAFVAELKSKIAEVTGGLGASVGVGSSKFIAKLATDLGKPDGFTLVQPGTEMTLISPMNVRAIPGVGPATANRLHRMGIHTIAELQSVPLNELIREIGTAHGNGLRDLAFARDDRPVEPEREAKSISVEDTFDTDRADRGELAGIIDADSRQVADRLIRARLLARTVTIKVRLPGFVTHTRSRTLLGPTDRPDLIGQIAQLLLDELDISPGVRLLGVGVSGLTEENQRDLFSLEPAADSNAEDAAVLKSEQDHHGPVPDVRDDQQPDAMDAQTEPLDERLEADAPRPPSAGVDAEAAGLHRGQDKLSWPPGADVEHVEFGRGWVWGSGRGLVTVRFETADTPPGPVRTLSADEPALRRL